MYLTKQERERIVFGEFSVAAGLMPGGWFCSRPEPEPDILYESDNGVSLAFELVEIIDQDYSNSIERQFDTKDACAEYLTSLPPAEQQSFQRQYADADIFLGFRSNTTLRRRKKTHCPESSPSFRASPHALLEMLPTTVCLTPCWIESRSSAADSSALCSTPPL